MTREKWETIVDKIDGQFGISNRLTQDLDDGSGGAKEVVEFSGPAGVIRLEFFERPRMIGEKTLYSNRIGGQVTVEKEYDQDDLVCFMEAYKQNVMGEWEKMDSGMFE